MPIDMPIAGVMEENENENNVNENRIEIENNENEENNENDENDENGDTENPAEISKDDETPGVGDGQSTSDVDDTIVEEPTVETIDEETDHDELLFLSLSHLGAW
jgi:hypothetical protein